MPSISKVRFISSIYPINPITPTCVVTPQSLMSSLTTWLRFLQSTPFPSSLNMYSFNAPYMGCLHVPTISNGVTWFFFSSIGPTVSFLLLILEFSIYYYTYLPKNKKLCASHLTCWSSQHSSPYNIACLNMLIVFCLFSFHCRPTFMPIQHSMSNILKFYPFTQNDNRRLQKIEVKDTIYI